MISVEQNGGFDFSGLGDFLEELCGKATGKIAGRFARYLKDTRYPQLFQERTGRTRESIGAYRAKGKAPAYLVRPGTGSPGNLNYLAGMARGRAKSRSGKTFNYRQKYDLTKAGWKAWGGESKALEICEETAREWIEDAEEKYAK